jgi:hypothetical protein
MNETQSIQQSILFGNNKVRKENHKLLSKKDKIHKNKQQQNEIPYLFFLGKE